MFLKTLLTCKLAKINLLSYPVGVLRVNIRQQQPNHCFTTFKYKIYNNNNKSNNLFINLLTKRYYSVKKELNNNGVSKKVVIKRSDIRRLFSLAKNEKRILAAAIGCLIISSTITMSVPFALGKILDIISKTDNDLSEIKTKLKNFCYVLIGIFIIGGIANFGRVYLFNSTSLRIVKDLRSQLYRKMLYQETSWFDTKGTGELINRLSTDTYLVGNSLSQNLSDGLRSMLTVIAGTGMMIYTSPNLAITSMCVVPCIAGIAIIYGRYVRNITRELLDKYATIMKVGEERLSNIKTVKIFSKEEQESKLFLNHLHEALKIGYREILAKASFYGMTGLSGNIIIISVLYYGGSLVATNEISMGALTSFILYAGYTGISIGGLSSFYTELNKGIGSAQRVWEILDRQTFSPLNGGVIPLQNINGKIVFDNVTFGYATRLANPIIKNLNLTILPGTTTAVVGRSGSGKSTLAFLLLRLYKPQIGNIYLDDININNLNTLWLRNYIGAVNQEPVLFSGTIRENILYGLKTNEKIKTEDFNRVLVEAHIDEFVNCLPKGLETIVGQRGMMLSGGQKQRIAIARALIKNPSVLVLDEATSALDAVSEESVQRALESLTKGRTVLTIAHRFSTIRNAEKIVVLDAGGIAEEGTYHQLITKENGSFQELMKLQMLNVHKTDQTAKVPTDKISDLSSNSSNTSSSKDVDSTEKKSGTGMEKDLV